MRRRSDSKPLKAAIEEFLRSYHLDDKLNEAKVVAAWNRVVGEMIAKNTGNLRIRNRVLYVTVGSAPLRNELMFARTRILTALNKEAGARVIDEIVFK
jgi:predicted nucleic acid-binding Zn ribbon protein